MLIYPGRCWAGVVFVAAMHGSSSWATTCSCFASAHTLDELLSSSKLDTSCCLLPLYNLLLLRVKVVRLQYAGKYVIRGAQARVRRWEWSTW
jgi:hypothetical protein